MARSTEAASPIWTMAEPSFVFRNLTWILINKYITLEANGNNNKWVLYFEDVAVKAEQVEDSFGIHFVHIETIDHEHSSLLRSFTAGIN